MNLQDTIKHYFTRENLIEMLTNYELYYQIGLGNYIFETLQDIDETYAKIEELHLEVNPNDSISNIFELILHYSHQEDFEERFHYHLRARALMHALKDFANSDKELLNKDIYIDQKTTQILQDTFFNANMKAQQMSEYSTLSEAYELMITDEMVSKLQENLSTGLVYQ